ncbi:hypothetical protein FHS43_006776 [Streptosporangium becharense]|uniref:Uncharacterized protein n=1 Tax=Streptosporangium becharense TaxID=1816182 RepID=A0A7W9ICI7_9ACTN|nr:hypothetical protein [Streptosporangium becharense]MBB2915456.1 hypothetical protein [Streptosporangium becharense]MBB5817643.1 hypothetical protein [Streptosporangium becharense]
MREAVSPAGPARDRPVPGGLLYCLRILTVAQAVGLVAAASFSGHAAQGAGAPVGADAMAGTAVHLIALLQVGAAVLVWRPGRGAGWPAAASAGLFLAGTGRHPGWETLGIRLPGDLILFGLSMVVLVWAWSPGAAVRRS